eukprot:TRINITY_DN4451_c0_g1_i1.p1 TRINITY_DN4451_c0_g1~~TRINITY_DN4451_c0_g1_i1.p1  ORF type:complete len:362 (+),score=98.54 TRINITY_DN4451_c0_g1_i1:97-1182(+)
MTEAQKQDGGEEAKLVPFLEKSLNAESGSVALKRIGTPGSGLINQNFHVTYGPKHVKADGDGDGGGNDGADVSLSCLLRIYPNESFVGPTYDNELGVLKWLATTKPGIAPRLIDHDFSREHVSFRYLLTEFIDGSAVTPQQVGDILPEVAALLREIHETAPPEHLHADEDERTNIIPESSTSVGFTVDSAALGAELHEKLVSAWDKVTAIKDHHTLMTSFSSLPRTQLLHGDAHCGNILRRTDTSKLTWIDWEGARVGHCYEDIASFLVVSFPPLSTEQVDTFLEEYGDETKSPPMLNLFKIRKLCPMIAYMCHALSIMIATAKETDGDDAPPPQQAMLLGGVKYFLSVLEQALTDRKSVV